MAEWCFRGARRFDGLLRHGEEQPTSVKVGELNFFEFFFFFEKAGAIRCPCEDNFSKISYRIISAAF